MVDKRHIRILVVEDEPTLAQMLRFNLELEGYDAVAVNSAEQALSPETDIAAFSLILLDVMMGGMSGFEMAKILKANPATAHIPIIFCTAKDNEDDMVQGLALGGDDYIYKPYTLRNVFARIEAVLRRCGSYSQSHNTSNTQENSSPVGSNSDSLTLEGIRLDRNFKRCFVNGREVKLVKKEFEILELLMSNPGRIFSREEILQKVWKGEVIVLERTIDVNITRVRQKIAPYGEHIITRAGYGYGFN